MDVCSCPPLIPAKVAPWPFQIWSLVVICTCTKIHNQKQPVRHYTVSWRAQSSPWKYLWIESCWLWKGALFTKKQIVTIMMKTRLSYHIQWSTSTIACRFGFHNFFSYWSSLQSTGSLIMIKSGALKFDRDSKNDQKFCLSSIYGSFFICWG